MYLNVPISLILIFILTFLISTFDKISFKNVLLISDIMYFKFIYIMTFAFNKTKKHYQNNEMSFLKNNFYIRYLLRH